MEKTDAGPLTQCLKESLCSLQDLQSYLGNVTLACRRLSQTENINWNPVNKFFKKQIPGRFTWKEGHELSSSTEFNEILNKAFSHDSVFYDMSKPQQHTVQQAFIRRLVEKFRIVTAQRCETKLKSTLKFGAQQGAALRNVSGYFIHKLRRKLKHDVDCQNLMKNFVKDCTDGIENVLNICVGNELTANHGSSDKTEWLVLKTTRGGLIRVTATFYNIIVIIHEYYLLYLERGGKNICKEVFLKEICNTNRINTMWLNLCAYHVLCPVKRCKMLREMSGCVFDVSSTAVAKTATELYRSATKVQKQTKSQRQVLREI